MQPPAIQLPDTRPVIAEFKDVHPWDFGKFTRGERFVYQPLPRAEFDDVMAQVKRWGLDDHLKEKSFDRLAFRV